MSSIVCPQCREKNNPSFAKCWKCGADLGGHANKPCSTPSDNLRTSSLPTAAEKSAIRSEPLIVQWAETKMHELKDADSITPDSMFAGFIYALSTFAKKDPSVSKKERGPDIFGVGSDDHFANDSALFELGCYMYFRIDMWFFMKHRDLRETIMRVFCRSFTSLFSNTLRIDTSILFKQRIEKYGELARSKADAKQYHFYLSELILRTKDGQKPELCSLGQDFLPSLGDFFQDYDLKIKLVSWETAMLPALVNSMEEAVRLLK